LTFSIDHGTILRTGILIIIRRITMKADKIYFSVKPTNKADLSIDNCISKR